MSIHQIAVFYNNAGDSMFQRIRDLREDRDLTQKQVATVLNCSQQVYSNYELGQRDLPTAVFAGTGGLLWCVYGLYSWPHKRSDYPKININTAKRHRVYQGSMAFCLFISPADRCTWLRHKGHTFARCAHTVGGEWMSRAAALSRSFDKVKPIVRTDPRLRALR